MSPEARLRLLRERRSKARAGRGTRTELDELVAKERRIVEDIRSQGLIAKTTMACPACASVIAKSAGCNKMTCATCGAYFCYRCGKDISDESYAHFGSAQCELFDQEEVQAWEARMAQQRAVPLWLAVNRRLVAGRHAEVEHRRCPMCKANHVKAGRNNHVRCWGCGNSFCFLCATVLRKGMVVKHFKGACKQHS